VGPPEVVLAGRAFVRGRLQPVEVGITEGRIVRVARAIAGGRRIDVGDQVILPAATDLHVHLREPSGPDSVEGFASGTEAAALGGVTAVADMPNTEPAIATAEDLESKAARARGQLAVDLVLFGAVGRPGRLDRLAEVAGALKLFLSPTPGMPDPPSMDGLSAVLAAVRRTPLALTVHAEDPGRFPTSIHARSLAEWTEQRPIDAETGAVDAVLAEAAQMRLHVAHVTTATAADAIRREGYSFEATPHHLLLAADETADTLRKVNPPLRAPAEQRALWVAYCRGEVPCIASDHAPHSTDAKGRPFDAAPSGMPGVETMLPLLLERVRAGELPLEVLLRTACDRPARWLGLPHGRLAPGDRANLIVVDFRRREPLRADRLRTACGWSAFERWPAIFPRQHYRDGERVVDDGSFVGGRSGRVVRPDYASRVPRAA
jgi:dihydroorotase